MKAALYEKTGPANEVLSIAEINQPAVTFGHVRVKVFASGINPSDIKQRGGWGGLTMRFPHVIPHNDGAGVIESVGEGVPESRIGERVWIYEATLEGGLGTAAEFVVVPSETAIALPQNTTFAEGACLGVPAMTAHHCVLKDGDIAGQTVLVTGGAGAVGNYAIQFAKWANATVITTVSSDEKAEIAKAAGADYVINYKTENVAKRVKEIDGKGVDRVIEVDFGANLQTNLKIIKRNGVIATYASDSQLAPQVSTYDLIYKNLTVHYVLVYAMSKAAHQQAAKDINTCLEAGFFKHVIAQRFTLDQIAEAHELLESGRAIGNLILEIS
jgi:NADPH2:quinone reductase